LDSPQNPRIIPVSMEFFYMSSTVILIDIPLVTVSKDKSKLPNPITCNECIIDHGKSKCFDNCSSKYWHIKINHSKHDTERNEKLRIKRELRKLRELSEKNQRGLL